VIALAGENAALADTLAAALARSGQFQDAVSAQTRAISLTSDGQAPEAYQKRLELYRQGIPYIEQ